MVEVELVLALVMSSVKVFPGFSQAILMNYLHPVEEHEFPGDSEAFLEFTRRFPD